MLLPVILNDVLDSIARLDSPLISRTFELLPATLDRLADRSDRYLALLEKSMLAAATVNRPDALQSLTQRFGDYVESQRSPLAASQWEGLTGQSFRCLRRLGLKSEAERLLGRISDRLTDRESFAQLRTRLGPQWPRVLHTLLHVAAGWYYCGRDVEGHRIIDDARLDLYQGQMPVRERTAMAMSYAATLGHIPVRLALSRFDELFQRLKKVSVNGWNSHYTLQPLKLIDTVIRSLVNEDFTLGPGVRGWLDDEEYRVRGRLAREVGDLMRQQNVS